MKAKINIVLKMTNHVINMFRIGAGVVRDNTRVFRFYNPKKSNRASFFFLGFLDFFGLQNPNW